MWALAERIAVGKVTTVNSNNWIIVTVMKTLMVIITGIMTITVTEWTALTLSKMVKVTLKGHT